ncbi:MAG: cadherin repeat domain-containing protein [Cellvibrionales bacterium]|nr:cadherin repeat domain-containing protein [Cellvibrionales bacterium]
MKAFIFTLVMGFGALGFAAQQEAERQLISLVRVYEKPRGDFHALIQLWAGRTGGRNPDANDTPCEIWTKNKGVFNQALEALISDHPVEVTYSGRGDKDTACQVAFLTVPITDPIVTSQATIGGQLALATSAEDDLLLWDGLDIKQAKLAAFDDDSFIVVWAEALEGQEATQIKAQYYTYKMYPDGDAFVVNTSAVAAGESLSDPNVVVVDNGNYAVTWNHWDTDSKPKARYRVFDESGQEVRAEKNVPSTSLESMQLVALSNGGFAVIGLASQAVKLDVFDETGATLHRRTISNLQKPYLDVPDVVELSNGYLGMSFGRHGGGDDTLDYAIYRWQTYDFISGYNLFGEEPPTGVVDRTQLVALDDGHAAILYASEENIYIQRFDALGNEVGGPLQVNESEYAISDIAMTRLKDGSLFVSWVDESASDTDGSGIYGRRFNDSGTPLTDEMLINRRYQGDQFLPHMIQSRNGPLYAYWTSTYSGKESVQVTQVGVNQITTRPNSYTLVGKVPPPEGSLDNVTYSLVDDADGRFIIFSNDGTIKVRDRDLIDYDDATEHTIRVQIADGDTATEQTVTIKVVE